MAIRSTVDENLPVIARFEVRRRSYVAPDGTIIRKLPAFAADTASLIQLYRAMVLTRAFDLKAVSLQRTGRLGTYAVSLGQEAVSVGVASAMRQEDVLLPSYRDNGTLLWRGVKMEEILLYWGGDERGNFSSGPPHDFPFCIPVGSQAPHAAGVAYAFKFRKEPRVAVCLLGDGATSKGDVYEAMNFAGVHKLPLVFVVNNNQWAISVPLSAQTVSSSIAVKAVAYGMPGIRVDGNDLLAVIAAQQEAVARARSGGGPTLIESVTFRMGGHSSSDDPTRYRDAELVKTWENKDPVTRYGNWLRGKALLADKDIEQWTAEITDEISKAITEAEALPPPAIETIFTDVYAEMPAHLKEQCQHALATGLGTKFEGAFPL